MTDVIDYKGTLPSTWSNSTEIEIICDHQTGNWTTKNEKRIIKDESILCTDLHVINIHFSGRMTHYHPSTPWEKVKDLEHFSNLLAKNETLKSAYDESRYQLAAGVLPKTGVLLCLEQSGHCLSYKYGHWHENGRLEVPGMEADAYVETPQASDSEPEFFGRKYGQFTMTSENTLIYTGWGYSVVYEDDLSDDNFDEFGSWKKDSVKSMNFERICHTTVVDKNTGTIYSLGGTDRENLPIVEVEQLSAGSENWKFQNSP